MNTIIGCDGWQEGMIVDKESRVYKQYDIKKLPRFDRGGGGIERWSRKKLQLFTEPKTLWRTDKLVIYQTKPGPVN